MAASRFINCLVIVIIINICAAELLQKPQLTGENVEESNNELDLGEPPVKDLQKRKGNANDLIGTNTVTKQRYKCHSCESPDCSNPTVCYDALQCWISRVRDSSGEERVLRGCTLDTEQLPLICPTPSLAVQHRRHPVAQFDILCCVGDFCNDGDFPEPPPLFKEEIQIPHTLKPLQNVV